jgi:hypothetical protein
MLQTYLRKNFEDNKKNHRVQQHGDFIGFHSLIIT